MQPIERKQLGIKLNSELWREFRVKALKEGTTATQLIEELMIEALGYVNMQVKLPRDVFREVEEVARERGLDEEEFVKRAVLHYLATHKRAKKRGKKNV